MLSVALNAIIKSVDISAEAAKKAGEAIGRHIIDGATDASGQKSSASLTNNLAGHIKEMNKILKGDTSGLDPDKKDQALISKTLSQGFESLGNTFKGVLTSAFEVLQTIYNELKKSSPLLQAVEQLFNLAWTLFFMPIGNKLGEVLIPAVIQLLDDVMALWDAFEGKTLGEMIDTAIEWGINALADFLNNIGDSLIEQGGWIADLGEVLKGLASFTKNNLAEVIKFILSAVEWVVTHLGTMIGLIGTFMSLHYALQLATMAVIAASSSTPWGMALGTAAAATAVAGIGISWGIGSKIGLADGGYVPSTPGGQVHILGEGGEGEYVIPESKAGAMGTTHYTINNYMMSTDEMDNHIRDVIRGEVSASKLRSGF